MPSAQSRTAVHLLAALQLRRHQLEDHEHSENRDSEAPTRSRNVRLDKEVESINGGDAMLFIKPKVLKHPDVLPPRDIEDVPFRRQDRRILNGRKKRVLLRKMIVSVMILSLLLMAVAAGVLFYTWNNSNQNLNELVVQPLSVVGVVFLVSALAFLVVTMETCCQLRVNKRKVRDPEIDRMTNLHHVKHWIAPELVTYGWGHEFAVEDQALDVGRGVGVSKKSNNKVSVDSVGSSRRSKVSNHSQGTRETKPMMLKVGGESQEKLVGVYMFKGA